MARAPYFSVIISTFNRPALLKDALESVRNQTVDDFECIVVNDGVESVDLPADDRFMLIDKREGAGMSAAINTGVREARGRYLTFLDDDDAYTPHRLELGMRGSKIAPLAICWRADFQTGVPGRNRKLEGWVNDVVLDRSPPFLGQATVERTRMVPLDERIRHANDVEWWIRSTAVMPVTTIPEVGFLFRRHPERQSTNMAIRYSQRMILYEIQREYFRSHRRAAARFHKRTGIFAYEAGRYKDARKQLWAAVKVSPGPRSLYRLGRALMPRRGSRSEALFSDP